MDMQWPGGVEKTFLIYFSPKETQSGREASAPAGRVWVAYVGVVITALKKGRLGRILRAVNGIRCQLPPLNGPSSNNGGCLLALRKTQTIAAHPFVPSIVSGERGELLTIRHRYCVGGFEVRFYFKNIYRTREEGIPTHLYVPLSVPVRQRRACVDNRSFRFGKAVSDWLSYLDSGAAAVLCCNGMI